MLIGSNSTFYLLNRIMSSSMSSMETSLERLTSGTRLNSASDDPANVMYTGKLNSNARSMLAAMSNAQTGLTYTQLAANSYEAVLAQLQEAKSLATQASSRNITTAQRASIQDSMDNIMVELKSLKAGAHLDGLSIFGSGEIGSVTTTVTETITGNEPTVLSGANDYVTLSTNVDPATIEVRDASDNLVAYTIDNSTAADGYVTVNFAGTTNATVTFDNPVTITDNVFDIKELDTNIDPAPVGYTVIYDAQDLKDISNDMSGNYILAGNIDLSGESSWSGIGGTADFAGILDGNGFTISGLSDDTTGLFQDVDGGTIKNMTISNFNLVAAGGNAGIVTGDLLGGGTVENVRVINSSITATGDFVGGIVGKLIDSTVQYSSFQGSIDLNDVSHIGGIVGVVNGTSLIDHVDSNVNMSILSGITNTSIGGIIGYMSGTDASNQSILSNSKSSGTLITAAGTEYHTTAGGVGNQAAYTGIQNTLSSMDITFGGDEVLFSGGLVGQMGSLATITGSAYTGDITLDVDVAQYIGGLVGIHNGAVSNSYSTGSLSDGSGSYASRTWIGGFSGLMQATASMTNTYSETDISIINSTGKSSIGGMVGRSTSTGTISQSNYNGTMHIVGGSYIGGFIGNNEATTIETSYSSGTMNLEGTTTTGGFSGYSLNSNISDSYSDMTMNLSSASNTLRTGGFAGFIDGTTIDSAMYSGTMNVTAIADVSSIGGFVGATEFGTDVDNSYSEGTLNLNGAYQFAKVGGFVGSVDTLSVTMNIDYSHASMDMNVTGGGYLYSAGGFAGYGGRGRFTGDQAKGTINSSSDAESAGVFENIGGFSGSSLDSYVNQCYAENHISSNDEMINVGGFAGSQTQGTINQSRANTNIVDTYNGAGTVENVGGFVGEFAQTTILNSYSEGTLTSANNKFTDIGGFIGDTLNNLGTVENSYSKANIPVTGNLFLGSGSSPTFINSYVDNVAGNTGDAAITKLDFTGGDGIVPGWDTGIWTMISNGYPTLTNVSTSYAAYSTAGKGSTASTINPAGTGATLSQVWDPNPSAPAVMTTNTYNKTSDLVSTGTSFTPADTENLFGNADDTYITNLVLSQGATTYTQGVDYDWYIKDGGSQYTLEILNGSLVGQNLNLDYDMVYKDLDYTFISPEVVTYTTSTSGTETFDTINTIDLQVGIDSSAYSRHGLDSFAMDLGFLHLGVDTASSAKVAMDSIDQAIDHITIGLSQAEVQGDIITDIMSNQVTKYNNMQDGISKIVSIDEAEETANFMAEQLKYETASYMMNFMAQRNYGYLQTLLDMNGSEMPTIFGQSSDSYSFL